MSIQYIYKSYIVSLYNKILSTFKKPFKTEREIIFNIRTS